MGRMIIDTEFNSAADIPAKLCVDGARRAERSGFGAVWKGESNSRDPLVLLTQMAAMTGSIDLGTAIYHVFGRSPVTMAIQAATFNELNDGRLIVGLGVGTPVIANWHGGGFERPLRQMIEYIDILRAAYAGEKVPDFEGDFFSTSGGFKLAFQPTHPLRIMVAGLGPQMARLAGRLSDGIIINMANPPMIAEIAENFREGAREAGRDPSKLDIIAKVRVCIHPDPAVARGRLKRVLTFYALQKGYAEMLRKMGWGEVIDTVQAKYQAEGFHAARREIPDEMVDDVPMYASSDLGGLKARLNAYAEAGSTRCNVPYVPAGEDLSGEIEHFLDEMAGVIKEGDLGLGL